MRTPPIEELLRAWERGRAARPVERAMLLLAAARPEADVAELTGLAVGRRDAQLLMLRAALFGETINAVTRCPQCATTLDLAFTAGDIHAPVPQDQEVYTATMDGWRIEYRLPRSADLIAVVGLPHEVAVRRAFERCVLSVLQDGAPAACSELPPEVAEAVLQGMAEMDPQADVQLRLSCPACRLNWLAVFDVVSFFWAELETWAVTMLRDVSELARAFGWRESDILALSPIRRQAYLELVRG